MTTTSHATNETWPRLQILTAVALAVGGLALFRTGSLTVRNEEYAYGLWGVSVLYWLGFFALRR